MSTTASSSSDLVRSTRQQLDELDALLERMLELPVDSDSEPSPREKPRPSAPPEQRSEEGQETQAVLDWLRSGANQGQPRPTPPTNPAPEAESGDPDEGWVPLKTAWEPSAQTWGPLAESWREANSQEEETPPNQGPPQQQRRPDYRAEEPSPSESQPTPSVPSVELSAPPIQGAGEEQEQINATLADALSRLRTPESEEQFAKEMEQKEPRPSAIWAPLVGVNKLFDSATGVLGPIGGWMRSPMGRELLAWVGGLSLVAAAGLLALDRFGWTW